MARETELKYEADPGTALPRLDGLPGVHGLRGPELEQLEAEYYDTDDLRLLRAGVTLRRRKGGHDAGWHLKLPAGPDTRTEIHAPLAASGPEDTVPNELLDVVLAIVRDRPVRPVARITTKRESRVLYSAEGTALAEFSNDHVIAWAAGSSESSDSDPEQQEWREWELELIEQSEAKNGAPNETAGTELLSRLSNRLLDAGAVPAG